MSGIALISTKAKMFIKGETRARKKAETNLAASRML